MFQLGLQRLPVPARMRGLTLLELLITLSIFGFMLAIGLPNASNWLLANRARSASEFYAEGFSMARRQAVVHNTFSRISLTPTEFEILRHLASRPGRVYTRSELLELLRDYEALDQDEKTINVHVSHLRDKLEDDPSQPVFVQTIRGVGYAFAER